MLGLWNLRTATPTKFFLEKYRKKISIEILFVRTGGVALSGRATIKRSQCFGGAGKTSKSDSRFSARKVMEKSGNALSCSLSAKALKNKRHRPEENLKEAVGTASFFYSFYY